MQDILDNKYVFWIITGLVGGLFSLLIYLLKKQIEGQAKTIERVDMDGKKNAEKLNDVLINLPVQYTLRDEFLRVVTDQNRRFDKFSDTLSELSATTAAIKEAVTGGKKSGD